ncbi:MAG: UDP-N-acetylmuramate dehydrogenase [Myxococcota bacterium]|nr:UDP-N-acetylmuramate dehydrogenase [Myxococcota bacterium]
MRTRTDVALAPLTTLGLGGRAARMVALEREDDARAAAEDAKTRREPLVVLGGGSNVVVGDEGFAGVVAQMEMRGIEVRKEAEGVVVDVAAGQEWEGLVALAVDEGWLGVECMSGIPGRVGAVPIQNVGAYGQESSQTIHRVRAYDREVGAFVDLPPSACAFGYRSSVFKRNERWIVTSVRFVMPLGRDGLVHYGELARALSVREGQRAPARLVRDTVLALRRAKGMVVDAADPDSMSAGSFFVNPVVGDDALARIAERAGETPPRFTGSLGPGGGRHKIPAAWLVERAGFPKGSVAGPVGVSRKHALALINRGGATTRELLALARSIASAVRRRFDVSLEPEPVFVGCSWDEEGL